MNTPRDWSAIQRAADDVTVKNTVRADGVGSLVWGAIITSVALFLGPNPLALVIGLALLATGAWQVAAPHPAGFIVSGSLICAIGVLNILDTVAAVATHTASGPWAVVGVFQLMWGVRMIGRFRRFRNALESPVDAASAAYAAQLLDGLRKARVKETPDVIEFTTEGAQPLIVRAKLMPEGAACLVGRGHDVRLVTRAQLHLERTGKAMIGSSLKARVRLAELQWNASISPESFERWERWAQGGQSAAA